MTNSHPLTRLALHDLFIADEELGGALLGTANDRQQARDLLAGDQPELSAFRARQNSPIGVLLFAHVACIFQHKDGSRLHLFGDPLAQDAQFSDHVPSFRTVQEALRLRTVRSRTEPLRFLAPRTSARTRWMGSLRPPHT